MDGKSRRCAYQHEKLLHRLLELDTHETLPHGLDMKFVTANSNVSLAKAVAKYLRVRLCKSEIKRFADGEVSVEIQENVRGEDVFALQSTSAPANDHLLELLITIDALKRASARRITAVIPYFGYARQDRKMQSRMPISAKLVANLITAAGAHRVLTMDLHAGQIQGFFDIPVDNLVAAPVFVAHIRREFKTANLLVVSPDIGGVVRARALADRLGVGLAIIDKRRPQAGKAEVMNIIGDVRGYDCLMADDIVDSAGTLCNGAKALKQAGAKQVLAYITHGVLSHGACTRVEKSDLTGLFITDTIALNDRIKHAKKIRTISVAPLIGEAINRIAKERSVSSLFD